MPFSELIESISLKAAIQGPVFIAGFLFFGHCAVMCGPLVLIFRNHALLYHLGRIIGYTSVGALMGAIGFSLDKAGYLLSFQYLSVVVSVVLILAYVYITVVPRRSGGFRFRLLEKPALFMAKLKRQRGWIERPATFLAGILSALLPCGVLYPVWSLSAGSGSVEFGAMTGFSFVAGTIPGLYVASWLSKWITKIPMLTGKRIQIAAVILLLVSATFLVFFRTTTQKGFDFSDAAREGDIRCLVPGHGRLFN